MIDLDAAIKDALKQKNQVALHAFRALKTKALVKLTEAGREGHKPLSEEEFQALVRRELKERAEANEYLKPDSPAHGENQGIIDVLSEFLPAQLSEAELEALIQQIIADTGAAGPQDMGNVMKALRESGQPIDMGAASARVKALLSR
jgi:hypothetical protein